ncbi:MAG: TRAP transporter substrate-binding protein DctP [Desulfobacteraceae bacterium]|nr:TRAP transporter substrate-binding protein DctP [Desulfobacteraceae bacterium]
MKRVKIMTSVSLCLICTLWLGTDRAIAAPRVLKVSHQFAAGDVRDKMGRVFGDMVTEKTKGQIQFRHYPSQSLFKANDQWDAMRKGALDMSVFPLDYASGKVPQFSITLMPCVLTSVKQGIGWRNKPIGKKVEALMEQNGVKNVLWAWFDGGVGSKVRQIRVPADVKGTKLRAAGKKFELMLREAGASITSMPSSETYHALATGVIDTMLTSSASFVSYRLYEVLKYINVPKDYSIWFMTENLCISMETWKSLTPDQQKVFMEVAEWMHVNWIDQNFKSLVDELVQEFTKAGVQLHSMNEAEFNEWLEFAKKTAWKDFAQTVEGGQELLDLATQAMK